MKTPQPSIARDLTTGKETNLTEAIPPHVYTSVADWKPVPHTQFAELLHEYMSSDSALDEFNHGRMHTTGYNLDRETEVHIHYIPKSPGDAVSSPVLMTMKRRDMAVLCFASTKYGNLAPVMFDFDITSKPKLR